MLTEPRKMKFNMKLGIREKHMDKEATDFSILEDIIMKMNDYDLVQAIAVSDFSKVNYKQKSTWSEIKFQVIK